MLDSISEAWLFDSIYCMALMLLKIVFWRENVKILPSFSQRYNGCHYVTLQNL